MVEMGFHIYYTQGRRLLAQRTIRTRVLSFLHCSKLSSCFACINCFSSLSDNFFISLKLVRANVNVRGKDYDNLSINLCNLICTACWHAQLGKHFCYSHKKGGIIASSSNNLRHTHLRPTAPRMSHSITRHNCAKWGQT